jgi:Ca2+-binding EF-hand superfamily protein
MMKAMTMKKAIVALAATGFFAVANAADEGAFTKLDANADGYISAEESTADEALYKDWAKIDANEDGKVDAAEFSAFEASAPAPAPEGQ